MFIFISSIGVNGCQTEKFAFTEKSKPDPETLYAISKSAAEDEIIKLAESLGIEYVIIRPPLVYGSHAPGNFGKLLKIMMRNPPLPFLLVSNKRSMVSIENLVSLIALCVSHEKAKNEVFLVSDNSSITTPELLKSLASGMGKTARVFPFPVVLLRVLSKLVGRYPTYVQLCGSLEVDTTKAINLLGWEPNSNTLSQLKSAATEFKIRVS